MKKHPRKKGLPGNASLRNFLGLGWVLLLLLCGWPGQSLSEPDPLAGEDLELIIRLAEAGDPEAQFSYALMLDHGVHMPMDETTAVKWYAKAAAQGLPAACFYLGMKYAHGGGVDRDIDRAIRWYTKAALKDWPAAQYQLGILFLDDSHPLTDPVKAVAWLRLAEENDYPDAGKLRKQVEKEITAKQLRQAAELQRTLQNQIRR